MKLASQTGIALLLVLILITLVSLLLSHLFSQSLMVHRTAKNLSDSIQARQEKTVKLKIKSLQLLKNPELYMDNCIGFVPDHLEFACPTGVSLYRFVDEPYQSVIAARFPDPETHPIVHPYVDIVLVGKAKNHYHSYEENEENYPIEIGVFQANKTFAHYREKLNKRKPFYYALSKEGQVLQIDAKTDKTTASYALLEKSLRLISGHIIANEVFYERRWRTVLMVVANFVIEGQNQSKSMIKLFDITEAEDHTASTKVFSIEKIIQLNPNLNQLIKPVMIRLPKPGFGFAIGGISVETGKSTLHLVFLDSHPSIVLSIPDKHLFYLAASDVKQSNWSNILNIAADNLYQVDFAAKDQTLKKLAELTCALPPLVVPSIYGIEPNIIAIGTVNTTNESVLTNKPKGLFRIHANGHLKLLAALDPDHYQAIHCRWGFIRLLPKQSGAMIKELDLSEEVLRSVTADEKWGDEKKYGQVSYRGDGCKD